MARVTVCIPAFKPGKQIAETLRSVQDQTYRDFKVVTGIEPTGSDAFEDDVRRQFSQDERFAFVENATVLGWAQNIDQLVNRVDTELFAILPHDDLWDQSYLASLVPLLDADPGTSVAYADMLRFGANDQPKTIRLDNTDISTRLLSFYLEGAEAVPWRGVTRRGLLPRSGSFPHHEHMSFAVECEYAQRLLCVGKAVRLDKRLYYKRTYGPGATSVSNRWSTDLSEDEKRAALEQHRTGMLAGIPQSVVGIIKRETIVLACKLAMLRRAAMFGWARLDVASAQRQRAETVRRGLPTLEPRLRQILSDYLDQYDESSK